MFPASFLLVQHPNVLQKLGAEVPRLSSETEFLSRADLRKMQYFQNVIEENAFIVFISAKDVTDICSSRPIPVSSCKHSNSCQSDCFAHWGQT